MKTIYFGHEEDRQSAFPIAAKGNRLRAYFNGNKNAKWVNLSKFDCEHDSYTEFLNAADFLKRRTSNCRKFIIATTGSQIQFYLSKDGNATAHHEEAFKFNSVSAAKCFVNDSRCYKILDAATFNFECWINY